MKIQKEDTFEVEKAAKEGFKYRYFCEGCTNIAFMGVTPFRWSGELSCAVCGKRLDCKPENWLPLSKEELKELDKNLTKT
jgi:rRNA maturation endonuclease Nob1